MTPALAERVAVVTGGTGALGQAVTLRFLADGAVVTVPYAVEAERERLAQRRTDDRAWVGGRALLRPDRIGR